MLEDIDDLHQKSQFFDDADKNVPYLRAPYLFHLENNLYFLNKLNFLIDLKMNLNLLLYQQMIKIYLMMEYALTDQVDPMVEEFNQNQSQKKFLEKRLESSDLMQKLKEKNLAGNHYPMQNELD